MTDERTRGLERQAALGDPGAQGVLLLHQLRAGEIQRGRLEIAAYCGHTPARHALSGSPKTRWCGRSVVSGRPLFVLDGGRRRKCGAGDHEPWCENIQTVDLHEWMERLGGWSESGVPPFILIRALVAHARWLLPYQEARADIVGTLDRDGNLTMGPLRGVLTTDSVREEDLRSRQTIEAVESWLMCPCESHREALRDYETSPGLGWPRLGLESVRLICIPRMKIGLYLALSHMWGLAFNRDVALDPAPTGLNELKKRMSKSIKNDLIAWALCSHGGSCRECDPVCKQPRLPRSVS